MRTLYLLLFAAACTTTTAPIETFRPRGNADVWLPGVVSTANAEVRITFSPDGTEMLWGCVGCTGGPGGWEIMQSHWDGHAWSAARPAPFDSSKNDFDPSFAPDGHSVFFFSNRDGGVGGDDIYSVSYDPVTRHYGTPENLGPNVNSTGDEWAPVATPDGKSLLFASDGRGGKGKHDLFLATRSGNGWNPALPLAALNSAGDDLDATFLRDGHSVVLTSDVDGPYNLYFVPYVNGSYGARQRLGGEINSTEPEASTYGPSISATEPQYLYFTSRRKTNMGRADIYRIAY